MPEALIRKRGGAIRYRTKKLPGGKYIHIAITRKKGPRGGRTVAGPVHDLKEHIKKSKGKKLLKKSRKKK